jgi:molybdopterin-guanine dinucleotide biosynthesis adapter protein
VAVVKPVLFQIAGYQNSGKTTLTLKLIERFSDLGLKVATIKHHGHGGKPDVIEKKDSVQHISAGAAVSLVEGGGRMIVQAEQKEWSLEEEIQLLTFFSPDVILIEGHKNEPYKKAVILRDEGDLGLLHSLNEVKVILYRDDAVANSLEGIPIPSYFLEEASGLSWIADYIVKKLETNDR